MMKLIKSFNILVVKDELGCISSTISNIYAFERYKTRLDLIILNTSKKNKMANLSEIKKYTDIPVLNYKNAFSTKKIFAEICRLLKLSDRGI